MSKEVKAALITGILGLVATITAAIIGVSFGKESEQKLIQNEINEVMGNAVNIIGDDNEVTINDLKDMVEDYQKTKKENESLIAQNAKYFEDLSEANEKIADLESKSNEDLKLLEEQTNTKITDLEQQLSNVPQMEYKNLGLTIDGISSNINSNNSIVIIDGKDYISKEILEKVIPNDKNLTIKDDTIFIGKVVADTENLFDRNTHDASSVHLETHYDSSGNEYPNSYQLSHNTFVEYDLDNKFSFLDITLVLSEHAERDKKGHIIIKADNKVIYTSPAIDKETKAFREQIPINNCRLLYIIYEQDNQYDYAPCIISDAIVYN